MTLGLTAWTFHGALKKSSPKSGEHLGTAPRELRLTFNERVEIALTQVSLSGASGAIETGAPALHPDSSSVVIVAIHRGFTEPGTYTVNWQIAGADGHPVRDKFEFTIAPGAAGLIPRPADVPIVAGDTTGHHPADRFPRSESFDAESPGYAAIRWLGYLGLLGVIGMVGFRVVLALLGRNDPVKTMDYRTAASTAAARLGFVLTFVVLSAGVLRVVAQSYALHGPNGLFAAGPFASMLTRTGWGQAWILQMGAALVAAFGFSRARRGERAGWTIAGVACVGLAFSAALSGHAAAAQRLAPLPVFTDAVHILAASGWLGTLVGVVAVGLPVARRLETTERIQTVSALVNVFSPTALIYGSVLVATGLFAAWIHLGAFAALWQSSYGRTLLLKLAVLGGVFATGAYNWLRVRPALTGEAGAHRLRRSATLELAIAVIVLLITAVLVATPPPQPEGHVIAIDSNVDE